MLHSLYRAYLYGIICILLFFTAIATTVLVSVLLEATPLNGVPVILSESDVLQPAVFAAISWVLTISVGGFHYWLLRRNQRGDGEAANDAVRSAFLNFSQGLSAFVSLVSGIIGINVAMQGSGATQSLATFAVFGLLFLLFELERRRLPATDEAALVFQRLHLSGLPFIILVAFIVPSLWNAVAASLYAILTSAGIVMLCPNFAPDGATCYYGPTGSPVLREWLIAGLVTAAWFVYWLLGRDDRMSLVVKAIHFLGFATGVIVILLGLERAFELLSRITLGIGATGSDLLQAYDFISPLVTGLLILAVYIVLLHGDRDTAPKRSGATLLAALAVAAFLAALPFWTGWVILVYDVVQHLSPGGSNPSPSIGLALVGTGLAYVPLALWQRARTGKKGATAVPQRALELGLLAIGMLDTVISLIVLLFTLITAILGNPLTAWQDLARASASGLVIGVVLLLMYGRLALAQRAKPEAAKLPDDPATAPTISIESVLDELLAGHITRDQAAKLIRTL